LNIDNKISPLPMWHYISKPAITVHLRNSNKQHLILTRFCTNNAPFVVSQSGKFQIKLSKQTIVTMTFVRWSQTLQFQVFVVKVWHKDLKLKYFEETSQKLL